MKKSLLIFLLLCICLVSFVSSAPADEKVWYKGDSWNDALGKFNLSTTNSPTLVTGVFGVGMRFVRSSTQYANTSRTNTILATGVHDLTITYWLNITTDCPAGQNCMFNSIGNLSGTTNSYISHGFVSAPPSWTRVSTGGVNNDSTGLNYTKFINKPTFFVIYYNSSNNKTDYYVGNTSNLTYYPKLNNATKGISFTSGNQKIVLGTDFGLTNGIDGVFADYRLFDSALNITEINALWNNGSRTTSNLSNLTSPNIPIIFNNTCVYSGVGNWFINGLDNCTLASTNLFGNKVFINSTIIYGGKTFGLRNLSNYSSITIINVTVYI